MAASTIALLRDVSTCPLRRVACFWTSVALPAASDAAELVAELLASSGVSAALQANGARTSVADTPVRAARYMRRFNGLSAMV